MRPNKPLHNTPSGFKGDLCDKSPFFFVLKYRALESDGFTEDLNVIKLCVDINERRVTRVLGR